MSLRFRARRPIASQRPLLTSIQGNGEMLFPEQMPQSMAIITICLMGLLRSQHQRDLKAMILGLNGSCDRALFLKNSSLDILAYQDITQKIW
jgi:hypothetical protein